MDSADSFMNWGFNPKQGSNKKPYYLIYGGSNPDDGEPYGGFMKFETLQDALKEMWEVWDSFENWKLDDVFSVIEEAGEGLRLFQGDHYGGYFPEVLYLNNKYPHYSWKPQGATQKSITSSTPFIIGLTETSGWQGEPETAPAFTHRIREEYETYIDNSPMIEDYAKKLESIPLSELVDPRRRFRWHKFYTILEMKYSADWNQETMKVVYAP
tara:strand:+ start:14064 stop:14699 length:636 start_codon:yes stop_codon:yes gene_type:complete